MSFITINYRSKIAVFSIKLPVYFRKRMRIDSILSPLNTTVTQMSPESRSALLGKISSLEGPVLGDFHRNLQGDEITQLIQNYEARTIEISTTENKDTMLTNMTAEMQRGLEMYHRIRQLIGWF